MADAKTEKQKVKEITDKLEEGLKELFESEKYKSYLSTMSKFHNYSFNNTLLIAMQKPEKAEKLGAELVMSRNYGKYLLTGKNENGYVWSNYYVYISKSKNGRQYLDSLGGNATVSDSGSFRKSSFVLREEL